MPRIFPILTLTCLLAFCLAAGCTVQVDDDGSGAPFTPVISSSVRVVRIVDGDTIRVAFPDGSQETVRILGIDTPETTVDGNDPGKFDDASDARLLALWGEEAAQYTVERLDDRDITIMSDRAAGTRDRYGRILAYITLPDGSDFGEDLVEQGLARVYTPESFARKDRYLSMQQQAMHAGRGIWSGHAPAAELLGTFGTETVTMMIRGTAVSPAMTSIGT
ncbi:endonucleasenuclease-like [hydrocarbon metagenome]|uniref:Endonucleasenuclease-like n=1 Tax=hydrocarbon metagenome TaxID=938273 RepID=A0A0W8EZR8_9ZZZZ